MLQEPSVVRIEFEGAAPAVDCSVQRTRRFDHDDLPEQVLLYREHEERRDDDTLLPCGPG